jgi:hypothetical protein
MSVTEQTPTEPNPARVQLVELYEGATCCESGVCGPSVDERLLTVREDVRWVEGQGANVARHNLASDPDAFVANAKVTGLMQAFGQQALPVLVIDGEIRAHGHYATRDPDYTRVIILTLAESTPIHEPERLQADLQRAGIEPYGRLVNSTLADTSTDHPTLRARAQAEQAHLERIAQLSHARTWSVPWQPEPPTGTYALRTLASDRLSPITAGPAR